MKPQFVIYTHRTCNDSYAIAGSIAYGSVEHDDCNAFQFHAMRQAESGNVCVPLQKLSLGDFVVDLQPSAKAFLYSDYVIGVPQVRKIAIEVSTMNSRR